MYQDVSAPDKVKSVWGAPASTFGNRSLKEMRRDYRGRAVADTGTLTNQVAVIRADGAS